MVELLELSRHNTVITVVDSVSKRAHFILTHIIVIAEGIARLFLYYIWELYRLPR